MNYQELLDAQNSRSPQKTKLPIGDYYRQTVDGKYRYVVDIRQQLTENIVFSEALKTECEKNKSLVNNHQLHYEAQQEGTDIVKLTIEQGSYQTFEQLLHDNPAVLAQQDFIDNTVKDLLETTAYLHAQGIWHICYAPQNVFARKGDNGLMLLSHGSFYLGMSDPKDLYEGMEECIA
ncbi:MAG: hypothetical protein IJ710_11080, partial [Prevotella sp.]|nr:hypothetical protein [Prevotella sp.]